MKKLSLLTKEEIEYLSSLDVLRRDMYYRNRKMKEPKKVFDVDKRIMDIFLSLGISAHLQGYQYLRESIKIIMEHPEYINNITKVLYPYVAEKFETTPCRVERGIRHAIEVSFGKGRMIYLNNIFGIEVLRSDERPTNSEFVALVADKLLLESR